MGFTGTLVLCRVSAPIGEIDAIVEYDDWCEWSEQLPGGWQVGQWPGTQLAAHTREIVANIAELTSAPALAGFVEDSDYVHLDAAAPDTGSWSTYLARDGARAHYDDGQGPAIDGVQPDPQEVTELAVAWATEAGLAPSPEALAAIFTTQWAPAPAEEMFFDLLTGLGVPPGHRN